MALFSRNKRIASSKQPVTNMRRRLLVLLLILSAALVSGIMLIFHVTGAALTGSAETEKLIARELYYFTSHIEKQYGAASAQAVKLSQALSENIVVHLGGEGLTAADLQGHPQLLENILGSQLDRLLRALENTETSGVFVVLNATVNPNIPAADYSRSGIYIRRMEPNQSGAGASNKLLLRGYPAFASQSDLHMQAKWDLEFNIRKQPFYAKPMEAFAANPELPLSRLVFWCFESALPELSEKVMLCSVPLLDGDGNSFGVCGFEISQMNFMLRNDPGSSEYGRIVCMLAASDGDEPRLDRALFAGSTAVYRAFPREGSLEKGKGAGLLSTFKQSGGNFYVGMSGSIRLYPGDSPFAENRFAALTIIPKEDYDAMLMRRNLVRVLIFAAFLALGGIAAVVLSRRYVKPITDGLDHVQGASAGEIPKTHIQEIDELIEKLIDLHKEDNPIPANLFEEFIGNVRALTPTEMIVFRYHAKGYSSEKIMSRMHIAPGTLKNHNRHIFQKLNVASRDELSLYAELMRKCGLLHEIMEDGEGENNGKGVR